MATEVLHSEHQCQLLHATRINPQRVESIVGKRDIACGDEPTTYKCNLHGRHGDISRCPTKPQYHQLSIGSDKWHINYLHFVFH